MTKHVKLEDLSNEDGKFEIESEPIRKFSFTSIKVEFIALCKLAGPSVVINFLSASMAIVDIMYVGHIGKEELAAAGLANAYFNILWYFVLGVASALDTLASQAYGKGDLEAVEYWTNVAYIVMLILLIPSTILLSCGYYVVRFIFMQPEEIAIMSGDFCIYLIPGLWFLGLFSIMSKSLLSRNILMVSVYTSLAGNAFNIILNWVFIYGLSFGFHGSPVATSCSRFIMLIILHHLSLSHSIDNHTYLITSSSLSSYLSLGLPGGIMTCMEAWSFDVTTIFASLLHSSTLLDGHVIMLNICGFVFGAFPLAISIAASIRIGNLIGAKMAYDAYLSSIIAIASGAVVMIISACLIATHGHLIGSLFSSDDDVIAVVKRLSIMVAFFQMCDGIQGTAQGVLRGLGRQLTLSIANFIAFWVIGVPLGYLLCFHTDIGLAGLWWGFVFGVGAEAIILCIIIYKVDWVYEANHSALSQKLGV